MRKTTLKTTFTIPYDGTFILYDSGKWMGLDWDSGGYPYRTSFFNAHNFQTNEKPYRTSFFNAHNFQTNEKALEYINHFPDEKTVRIVSTKCITFAADVTDLPATRKQEYEQKLAELKKEYGVV